MAAEMVVRVCVGVCVYVIIKVVARVQIGALFGLDMDTNVVVYDSADMGSVIDAEVGARASLDVGSVVGVDKWAFKAPVDNGKLNLE